MINVNPIGLLDDHFLMEKLEKLNDPLVKLDKYIAWDIFKPTLTQEDYKEWLEGLPERVRNGMEKLGFEGCKTVFPFARYVMKKNDIGLEEYIKMHMDNEDYIDYQKLIK